MTHPRDVAGPIVDTSWRRRSARRSARRLLLALEPALRGRGLAVRSWRAWEGLLTAAKGRREGLLTDDGLALPPPALRVRVVATADPEIFLQTGREEAATIAEACSNAGLAIEDAGRLLDFGCGCGRVLRHWNGYRTLEVHGTDHDASLIGWLRHGLPFVHAKRNGLAPPLDYPDDHFGVVYAVSVFTHMTDELSRQWAAELTRVVRPGGLLLYSALDQRQVDRLRPRERAAFDRGEPVVQFADALGTNMCVSYHPRGYIESITPGFDLVSTRRIGAQELNVLRAKSPAHATT
jgi:SAM-dependent methyltransferase